MTFGRKWLLYHIGYLSLLRPSSAFYASSKSSFDREVNSYQRGFGIMCAVCESPMSVKNTHQPGRRFLLHPASLLAHADERRHLETLRYTAGRTLQHRGQATQRG